MGTGMRGKTGCFPSVSKKQERGWEMEGGVEERRREVEKKKAVTNS